MSDGDYIFRPATRADLPMFQRWLQTPENRRWWGDPEKEYANLEEDFSNPDMVMRVVAHQARDFAYAQHYNVHTWPQAHFAALPQGTRAIDAFIGEPNMLGIGHGAKFLRVLAQQLMRDGAPCVAIDPTPENIRAVRAYRRAGFSGDTIVETTSGPAVLMIFDR